MKIEAKIEKIIFKKESGARGFFYILKTDRGNCLGDAKFNIAEGEVFTLGGEWRTSKFNGQQEFAFVSIVPFLPVDPFAALSYACSVTRGMGEAAARKIWEIAGGDWRNVDIEAVPGLTRAARSQWQVTLRELENQRERAEIFAWFMSIGMTEALSAAAWAEWGVNSAAVVQKNPYKLAELPYYGFKMIDALVLDNPQWDIEAADPRRIRAAIAYILDENANTRGFTAIDLKEILQHVNKIAPGVRALNLDEMDKVVKVVWAADYAFVARKFDYENEMKIWERWR